MWSYRLVRKRLGGILAVVMVLLLSGAIAGCQSPRVGLQQLAEQHGRQMQILSAQPFPLAALLPPETFRTPRLRVYLEGDGHAWATATQPSLDPSPRKLFVPRMAINDPTPSVYLARPCQFITAPACNPALWTDRRFSQDVVTSLSSALDQMKQRYGNNEFELIGYSGGATLALLLAGQRNDITRIQTIAGNLAPKQWTALKGLSPLTGSLDPLDYIQRLALIPQRHLSGTRDEMIPTELATLYSTQLGSGACSQLIVVSGPSHEAGWEEVWKLWRERDLEVCP
ncbi:putative esterase [Pseudomonas sp. PvP027]|uniref:alpha/beta hydrolase n=1 Tax=Pseudomonas TaxID=286 RepID=UPI0016565B26|nr:MULTISPECIES: alpha/beta hydrolase [Pseudomonas]MBC8799540.1 alpha/beta hydrolase [Pseudomonas congelans]MBP1145256.1 putative esterase [Pseudomonas sp. PvP027]